MSALTYVGRQISLCARTIRPMEPYYIYIYILFGNGLAKIQVSGWRGVGEMTLFLALEMFAKETISKEVQLMKEVCLISIK